MNQVQRDGGNSIQLAFGFGPAKEYHVEKSRGAGGPSQRVVDRWEHGYRVGRGCQYALLRSVWNRHRDQRESHCNHGQNTLHELQPFMLGM